jgi:hypothetical protein
MTLEADGENIIGLISLLPLVSTTSCACTTANQRVIVVHMLSQFLFLKPLHIAACSPDPQYSSKNSKLIYRRHEEDSSQDWEKVFHKKTFPFVVGRKLLAS